MPTLEDRIKDIRDEIDAIVASRVEEIAKQSPGVPSEVIRNLVIARAPGCSCAQYLELCRDEGSEAPKP
jgi:hypothetical protein